MSNRTVSDTELKEYLDTFLTTLESTATRFLAPEYASKLQHFSLLPARITAYLSTHDGLAFEYEPAAKTSIEFVKGSGKVVHLLMRAPSWLRKQPHLFRIAASHTQLINAKGEGGLPFGLDSDDASVTVFDLEWRNRNWSRNIRYAEVFADRSAELWSPAQAVSRAKDEVLAGLFEVNRAKRHNLSLQDFVQSVKSKTVLVLGSYDPAGRTRLQRISKALRELGYDPVLVDELPDHPTQDLHQKVTLLGTLARFVVVDDSHPGGQIAELELCRSNNWITAVLRSAGEKSSWMTASVGMYSTVVLEFEYDPPALSDQIRVVQIWAEKQLSTLKERLSSLYPWRSGTL